MSQKLFWQTHSNGREKSCTLQRNLCQENEQHGEYIYFYTYNSIYHDLHTHTNQNNNNVQLFKQNARSEPTYLTQVSHTVT